METIAKIQNVNIMKAVSKMNTAWFLWDIFINVLEYVLIYRLLTRKLDYTSKNKKWIIVSLFIITTIQTYINYIDLPASIITPTIYVLLIALTLMFFKGTYAMRIMWASACIIVLTLSNLVVFLVVTKTNFVDVQTALLPSSERVGPTTLYILICFAAFSMLMKFPNTKIDLPKNIQAAIIFVSVASSLLSGQLQSLAGSETFSGTEYIPYAFATLALIIFSFCFFYIIHKTGEYFYQDIESKNQIQSMEAEKKHNEQMHTVISAWEHDQRHHIAVLNSYAGEKNIVAIKDYLRTMKNDLDSETTLVNTGNSALNAILSAKLRLCQTEHISLKITAANVGYLPLSDTEISSMAGNILDNAIEACRVCQSIGNPAFIYFQIAKRRGMAILSSVNSSTGNYVFEDEKLLSSKKEDGHGYGIKRIRQIAERANGFVHIEPLNDAFKIEVCIPILDGGKNDS